MAYTAAKPPLPETPEQLRARIPGWGADLDPRDRPSVPREVPGIETGAHWEFPERQPGAEGRERSIEHAFVTPVFGTVQPLKGLSGVIRRRAYAQYSEARAAHWLLLIAADRVDAVESHLTSLVRLRPDNPITETGMKAELAHGKDRFTDRTRVDTVHHALDPVIVAGPWIIAAGLALMGVKALQRRIG
ncbi:MULTISPECIES: hypothetical protein [unclassified Actinotalea]|uniref:hypothetical protein n=1 Tax=unclassified Actinotalea TaxID=2638618 RepID=UPI0015F6BD60|nr:MULTISPECIES: hypothetical protein [unclassified Actinotalea]